MVDLLYERIDVLYLLFDNLYVNSKVIRKDIMNLDLQL